MQLKRQAMQYLRPFVRSVWLSDRRDERVHTRARRENVVPTGDMHLVFRLSDDPVRLPTAHTAAPGLLLGHTVVGGPRSAYYTKDVTEPSLSLGVQLKAGAAEALFGVSAAEL
ncbi:MAG TPA: DUF6597 domain-containing transcriptional factor, partial [Woeseiaceae bacterium]